MRWKSTGITAVLGASSALLVAGAAAQGVRPGSPYGGPMVNPMFSSLMVPPIPVQSMSPGELSMYWMAAQQAGARRALAARSAAAPAPSPPSTLHIMRPGGSVATSHFGRAVPERPAARFGAAAGGGDVNPYFNRYRRYFGIGPR